MVNSGGTRGIFVEQLRQSEIQHLGLATRGDHHVAGFDVAMNNSACMRCHERICDLNRDREGALKLQRPPAHQFTNVAALDVLHRDEVNAVDFVQIKNRADVRMVQCRSEAGFTFKPFKICFF